MSDFKPRAGDWLKQGNLPWALIYDVDPGGADVGLSDATRIPVASLSEAHSPEDNEPHEHGFSTFGSKWPMYWECAQNMYAVGTIPGPKVGDLISPEGETYWIVISSIDAGVGKIHNGTEFRIEDLTWSTYKGETPDVVCWTHAHKPAEEPRDLCKVGDFIVIEDPLTQYKVTSVWRDEVLACGTREDVMDRNFTQDRLTRRVGAGSIRTFVYSW